MFKRTNKAWKALALVLALCMLSSTVALADGDATVSTATLSDVTATYAEATQTATVTGKIDAKGNDVTILAVRGAAAATETDLAGWEPEDLKSMVTYIDQDTSAEADGSFSFSFIPGRGTGGIVTVFVGGEDVDDIVVKTFTAKMPAPGLVAQEKWYEGDNTVEFTLKKADLSAEYNGDLDAWWTAVNAVNVKIGDAAAVDMKATGKATYASGVLTIDVTDMEGVEIKEVIITTTANAYFDATWNVGVKQVKKTGGTLTAPSDKVVAGNNAAITVTSEDTAWTGALETSTFIGDATDAATGVDYEAGVLSVPMTIDAETEEADVVVTVKEQYYNDATATVKVIAPTAADRDALVANPPVVAYSASEFVDEDPALADFEGTADEKKDLFGVATVELPATGANGSAITWTIDTVEKSGTVELERALSTDENPKTSYAAVATFTLANYKTITKEFNINVNQCGVAGVEVSITLTMPSGTSDAAVSNVVKVNGSTDGVVASGDNLTFTATMSNGANTVELSNDFGYVTRKFTVNVDASADTATLVVPTEEQLAAGKKAIGTQEGNNITVAMVPGDSNGNGVVDGQDFTQWALAVWKAPTDAGYNKAANFTGNAIIDGQDFTQWALNVWHNEAAYNLTAE